MSKAHYIRQHKAFRKNSYKNYHLRYQKRKWQFHAKSLGDGKRYIDRW